jgi:hypothetical protein
MAHTLGLLGVWQSTGRVREAERAAALFHAYAERWRR